MIGRGTANNAAADHDNIGVGRKILGHVVPNFEL
jgi:hypothetical protein